MRGVVKWFDQAKGFGFVVADTGGVDILLHANVLRNFGQSSVADGAHVEISVQDTARGMQAVAVLMVASFRQHPETGRGEGEPCCGPGPDLVSVLLPASDWQALVMAILVRALSFLPAFAV